MSLSVPAPAGELTRSPAARVVGALAARDGLFCTHFEHRQAMPLPEHWEVRDRPDLGPYPWDEDGGWRQGHLPETKFRSFRLDRRIASFHPLHGPKWGAHELCHALVGFGWSPGVSALWHATAARLAEVLPVALWYFYDEAGLRRCPLHAEGGPLFGRRCLDCEHAAENTDIESTVDESWHRRGRAYVEREIDAAAKTLRTGQVLPSRFATLDLSTDGLAYVAAHGPVLMSDAFAEWVARFLDGESDGHHNSIDGLVARVRAVADALAGGPLPAPVHGGERRAAQDVGWRLLALMEDVEGEAHAELARMVERLATAQDLAGIGRTIDDYTTLHEDWVLPSPEAVFAVGYPLPQGHGTSTAQLGAGLASGLPSVWSALGDGREALVARFATSDPLERRPLARRFADWLGAQHHPLTSLARFEAALTHPAANDPAERSLEDTPVRQGPLRRTRGVEVVRLERPVQVEGGLGVEVPEDGGWVAVVRRGAETNVEALDQAEAIALLKADQPVAPDELDLEDSGRLLRGRGLLSAVAWRAAY